MPISREYIYKDATLDKVLSHNNGSTAYFYFTR